MLETMANTVSVIDILDELREDNNRLVNDLCFERNLNEILVNIRKYSLVLQNNCKCSQKTNVLQKFKRFNSIYEDLNSNRSTREMYSTNVESICESTETEENVSEPEVRQKSPQLRQKAPEVDFAVSDVFDSETDVEPNVSRDDIDLQAIGFEETFGRRLTQTPNKYVFECDSCDYKACNKRLLMSHKSSHSSPKNTNNNSNENRLPTKRALSFSPKKTVSSSPRKSLYSSPERCVVNTTPVSTPTKRQTENYMALSPTKKAKKSINDLKPLSEPSPKRASQVLSLKKATIKLTPEVNQTTSTRTRGSSTRVLRLPVSPSPSMSTTPATTPLRTPDLSPNKRLSKMIYTKRAANVRANESMKLITEMLNENTPQLNGNAENVSRNTSPRQQRRQGMGDSEEIDGAFRCTHCQHLFPTEFKLLNHLSYKHKVLSFECDSCDYKTSKLFYLQRHQTMHSTAKPYKCDVSSCGKRFKTKGILLTHKRQTHSGVKRFECDLCDYKTANKNSLLNHKSRHSLEKPFRCDVDGCDKQFKTNICLYQHKSVVHSAEQFICDWPQCSRLYNCKKALLQHQLLHTVDTPLVCGIDGCLKQFKEKRSLKRHQQNNCVMNRRRSHQ